MTNFNYDNFEYNGPSLGAGAVGPKCYCRATPPPARGFSTRANRSTTRSNFFVVDNPKPGPMQMPDPTAIGTFLDNDSQTYFNMGQRLPRQRRHGRQVLLWRPVWRHGLLLHGRPRHRRVLKQYKTLVGPAQRPPMYALGRRQSGHGYSIRTTSKPTFAGYRKAKSPWTAWTSTSTPGKHNRTFVISSLKFSTGRTPALQDHGRQRPARQHQHHRHRRVQPLDETGQATPNPVLESRPGNQRFPVQECFPRGWSAALPRESRTGGQRGLWADPGINPYPKPGAAPAPAAASAWALRALSRPGRKGRRQLVGGPVFSDRWRPAWR